MEDVEFFFAIPCDAVAAAIVSSQREHQGPVLFLERHKKDLQNRRQDFR